MLHRTHLLAATAALALAAAPVSAESFNFGIAARDFAFNIGASDGYDGQGGGFAFGIAARDSDRGDYRRHRGGHGYGRGGVQVGFAVQTAPVHHRRYVEGYFELVSVRRWVEPTYETVYVPAQYATQTAYDGCGRPFYRTVLVRAAGYEQVCRPGFWTTDTERRWVPGYWEEC